MEIIRNDVQGECEFRNVEVGAIFRCSDDKETLYMRIEDLNINNCGDNYLYNVVNLETFEIERKRDFEEVIVFDRSFLTVE